MSKEKKPTFSESKKDNILELELPLKEQGEKLRSETLKEIDEQAKETTPKTGRQTKDAKQAENVKVLIGGLETIITGLDAIISSKLPELKHEEEEIKTISTLGAPVLAKYVDLDVIEYKDEVKLASYLFMCEMQKVRLLTARLKKEADEKAEQSRVNEKDKKDAFTKQSKGTVDK